MDGIRTRIDDWLQTVPAPGPPDLEAAIAHGRRVRRARSAGWSAAALVSAVVVVAGAVALGPGRPDAVVPSLPPRTEVRYPDGTVVAWPGPAGGAWVVDGPAIPAADRSGQQRLREQLARAVPGSFAPEQVLNQYRVGPGGRLGGYHAEANLTRSDERGTVRAYLTVRMSRGGLAPDSTSEPYDPCGVWPGQPNLGDLSRRAFDLAGPRTCEVRLEPRMGSVVHLDRRSSRTGAPFRYLRSFTVRPDGTAVSVGVEGHDDDLDALRTTAAWQRLLDDLAATLTYPAEG